MTSNLSSRRVPGPFRIQAAWRTAAMVLAAGVVFDGTAGPSDDAARGVANGSGGPRAVAAAGVAAPFGLDDPERIEAGRKRFNKTCAGYCHGYEGVGGRAPDFKGRDDFSPEDAFETIVNGREGADVMPPWGAAFSEAQIWELVAYLRSLARQAPAD